MLRTSKSSEHFGEVVRGLRQAGLASQSVAQAQILERRLEDLEAKVSSNNGDNSAPEFDDFSEKIVTIESLREKRVLFAIMPFHEDFRDVWLGGIHRAANGTGLTPVRIDMINKSSQITDDIVDAIGLAELVVIDVTKNNPNVMFEFGFSLAVKKPHIIISQSTDYLCFDIKNLRTLIYQNTWKGIEDLHKDLQKFIKATIGDRPKTKPPAKKTSKSAS